MRLLLDTHIFLWYITGDRRIASGIRATIENAESVYVSVATLWEAITKYRLGKLALPEAPHPWLAAQREQHGFETLVIDEATVAHLSTLDAHHRDPFDRILVCQALEHDLQIVTVDPLIEKYPVKVLPPA
jgi:PIN domain nuclease of toxin-antitoxin system